MKDPYILLSLLILGSKAPGNKIDVYLQPLAEDLQELWNEGLITYDASTQQTFKLLVALLWTINDFPAYGNYLGGLQRENLRALYVTRIQYSDG